jgi:trimethylamine--corrinoid protein Co-methyltransferase
MKSANGASSQLRIWDDDACRRVHEATLTVLERCGVEVHHERAREILAGAGARVDGSRVRFDADLVESAIASAPKSWLIPSRGNGPGIDLKNGSTSFGTGPDCMYVRDVATGARRRATLRDLEEMAALADLLPNVDFVMSMVLPEDVDQEKLVLHQFRAMLAGTTKPIIVSSPSDGEPVRVMHDMAALCGEAASFACLTSVSPPLKHGKEALDQLLVCAELMIPLVLEGAPNCGVTAPSSISAAVVVGNAEVLSGLVLHQAARPGAPFVYSPGVAAMNMSTAVDVFCSPESFIGDQAAIDLCRFYGLPSEQCASVSDSKLMDEQLGVEFGITAVLGALSRATLLADVGYMESGLQTSCEAMVLGDEIVGYARSLLREVPVDEEALAVDEIIAVGPGGNHLTRPYTRLHHRGFWRPGLLDQTVHGRWQAAGSLTLAERVRSRTRALLAELGGSVLSEDVGRRLDDMIAEGSTDRRNPGEGWLP